MTTAQGWDIASSSPSGGYGWVARTRVRRGANVDAKCSRAIEQEQEQESGKGNKKCVMGRSSSRTWRDDRESDRSDTQTELNTRRVLRERETEQRQQTESSNRRKQEMRCDDGCQRDGMWMDGMDPEGDRDGRDDGSEPRASAPHRSRRDACAQGDVMMRAFGGGDRDSRETAARKGRYWYTSEVRLQRDVGRLGGAAAKNKSRKRSGLRGTWGRDGGW